MKPCAYFVAHITINDREEYAKYLSACDRICEAYRGEYLAADTAPRLLEGDWRHERIVIIRFPDEETLLKWYHSPEYQEILKYRMSGARCDSLLVHGG